MATWLGLWVWGVSEKEGKPPLSINFFRFFVAVVALKKKSQNRQTSFLTGPHFLTL